jgi:hypothetical protein
LKAVSSYSKLSLPIIGLQYGIPDPTPPMINDLMALILGKSLTEVMMKLTVNWLTRGQGNEIKPSLISLNLKERLMESWRRRRRIVTSWG